MSESARTKEWKSGHLRGVLLDGDGDDLAVLDNDGGSLSSSVSEERSGGELQAKSGGEVGGIVGEESDEIGGRLLEHLLSPRLGDELTLQSSALSILIERRRDLVERYGRGAETHGVVDGDNVDGGDSLGGELARSGEEFGDLRGASRRERSRNGDEDEFAGREKLRDLRRGGRSAVLDAAGLGEGSSGGNSSTVRSARRSALCAPATARSTHGIVDRVR